MNADNRRISDFYAGWHRLEKSKGVHGGLVIDFDMAPRGDAEIPDFTDRWDALKALHRIRGDLDRMALIDKEYLAAKLGGSEAYLRALMGERASFTDYVRQTMGVEPSRVSEDEFDMRREPLVRGLEALGIAWTADGREAWGQLLGRTDLSAFNDDLRAEALLWVDRLKALVPDLVAPRYKLEVVERDAYWSNWIDGSVEDGVVLKVNTHPRIAYQRFSHVGLAAHEIAGHAVHVTAMRTAAEVGRLDPCQLNLTVHACDAFHMEGLAQSMLSLVSLREELDTALIVLDQLRDWVADRINNAQIDIEDGMPIDMACDRVLNDCPLTKALSVRSSLRDRSLNPLYRSYIHVYSPSRRLFCKAAELDRDGRAQFLSVVTRKLMTPTRIAGLIAELSPSDEHSA